MRSQVAQFYAQEVPGVGANICRNNISMHDPFGFLRNCSCLAAELDIVIVINTVHVQNCSRDTVREGCPADGMLLFNTDVAFSEEGAIAARYFKSHIFSTAQVLNQPVHSKPSSFISKFGVKFGLIICYDMEFASPAQQLLASGVRHFLTSSSWVNFPPFLTAAMYQQGWSKVQGVVLLASNNGANGMTSGSGLYNAGNVLEYVFNPKDVDKDTILTSRVPTSSAAIKIGGGEAKSDAKFMTKFAENNGTCDISFAGVTSNCIVFGAETGKKLDLFVSQGTTECSLSGSVIDGAQNESFAVVAFEKNLTFSHTTDSLVAAGCGLIRCVESEMHSSSEHKCTPTYDSSTTFEDLRLNGSLPIEAGTSPVVASSMGPSGELVSVDISEFLVTDQRLYVHTSQRYVESLLSSIIYSTSGKK